MSVLFYIPIAWKVKSLLRRFKSQTTYGMSKRQQKQITAVTCTVALITLNQLVCFVIPDLILAFEIGHDSFVFYIMVLSLL
ncbi:hypothetical protein Ddc_01802 [Ditylenchus destructor]|nr:hypothetical protein Ddc_01802 [Ditylenchus destructor]